MHGEGHRRNCPQCGQSVLHMREVLANVEVRGPRNITSSNVDRIYDDDGKRFLIIEEKNPGEQVRKGQQRLLANFARLPRVDVWGVRGTPDDLNIKRFVPTGGWTQHATGDVSTYEHCVHAWFAASADDWGHALDVLGEVAYEPPAWCPPEIWREFDTALTKVMALHARKDIP